MKENSMSYRTAKQENERLICEIEEMTITHRAYTAECLRRVLKENELLRKDIEGWKKYCEEIEEEQTEMSNKNCELEFKVEKLQKENEELKKQVQRQINEWNKDIKSNYISKHKIKEKIEDKIKKLEIKKEKNRGKRDNYIEHYTIENAINTLQEVLKESEE